ncbi:MAG: VWA domain-containing protein [Phycisphaerales bacterium]
MMFIEPSWLVALVAVPLAGVMFAYARWRRRRGLRRFVGPGAAGAAWAPSALKRVIKGCCVALALGAVAVALARPGANPVPQKIERTGRDVAVLLDVSRSMLATDLKPNRLERAKLLVKDMLETARGDRVAIVAFAGSAVIRCPLTTDYSFARLSLDAITPETVARGGTLIGDAIRTAMNDLFTEGDDRYRDIVVITDGEDHESLPVEAAKAAGKRGIRIIAIGLGSDLQGATIPVESGSAGDAGERVMTYQGSEVRTRMDTRTLRDIAEASKNGVFLNVGTGTIQMDKIYRALVERAERRELESTQRVKYTELFQIALCAAIALLAVDALIGERRSRGNAE